MDLLLMLLLRFCVNRSTMDTRLTSGARESQSLPSPYDQLSLLHRGVVLYAMLCGILPFGDNQLHRLIDRKEVTLQFKSPHNLSAGINIIGKQSLTFLMFDMQ